MTPLARWRLVAFVTTTGWAATALAWSLSADAPPRQGAENARVSQPQSVRRQRGKLRRRRSAPPAAMRRTVEPTPGSPPVDLSELREEVREEVAAERSERRRQRSERRLLRGLDVIAQFAEEHDLAEETQVGLEAALEAMHARMEALRPEGGPGRDGPSPELREAFESSLSQLQADVDEVLGDPDLAEALLDQMSPRGRRGRR